MCKRWMSLLLLLLMVAIGMQGLAEEASLSTVDVQHIYDALQADPTRSIMDIRDKVISVADLTALLAAYPQVTFQYNVIMYGKTFSSDATVIDFEDTVIKEIDELEAGLALLPLLTQADMYSAKLTKEQMAELHERFAQMHFGWTVKLGTYKVRTDITAFSSLHNPRAKRFSSGYYSSLAYCWQLKALDLGHNKISDLSFLENLTDLRLLILADNQIRDISVLKNLTKLEYVELFMNQIKDITPLANMDHVMDLNLCHNSISDLSAVLTMPKLERLWVSNNKLETDYRETLAAQLPNVKIVFSSWGSTSAGWREHDRYFVIKDVFDNWVYRPFSTEE